MTMKRLAKFVLILLLAGAVSGIESRSTWAGPLAAAKTGKAKANRKKIRKLLRKTGLTKLPSVSNALAGRSTQSAGGLVSKAVVGTPPALVDIPGESIKDVFWQPGVMEAIVAGNATPEQCGQFWAGTHDGDSGGMGACHMAESVGYSFRDIVGGETSLCYMKHLPTPANVDAGAVTIVSGQDQLPGGDISRLFSVPGGAGSRLVKVTASGMPEDGDPRGSQHEVGAQGQTQDIFLRVSGDAENRVAHNFYKVEIWFCRGGGSPSGYNGVTIADTGKFEAVDRASRSGEVFSSMVAGSLILDGGEMSYDTTKKRRAQVESSRSDSGSFKGEVEINGDNSITTKLYDTFGGGARKAFMVNSFSGTSPDTLRFLAGAFKEKHSQNGGSFDSGFQGSTEYRSSFYAASPGSALEGALDAVDLDGDEFYGAPASGTVDLSGFACDATPDVAIALDFTNPNAMAVRQMCENRRFDDMHFCHDDPAVHAAEEAFFTTCQGH